MNIINPVPTITAASPAIVPAGATTTVTLTGRGFVPSTVIQVNGAAVPTTYVSPTSIEAQITVGANATGDLQVQASTSTYTGGLSDFFRRSDLRADQRDSGGAAARPDHLRADHQPDPARAA